MVDVQGLRWTEYEVGMELLPLFYFTAAALVRGLNVVWKEWCCSDKTMCEISGSYKRHL